MSQLTARSGLRLASWAACRSVPPLVKGTNFVPFPKRTSRHNAAKTSVSMPGCGGSMFQRLRDLLSLLVVSASFVTIFVIAPIFIALTLSSIDKRAHDLILYGTAVVAVLSGFYGMTKPQLDRSEARK